jgi:hypothetical protein
MTTKVKISTVDTDVTNFLVPSGAILMWSGTIATIPSGWRLCDGTNSTPDLRNRFVIGASADSGGQANTTVTGATTKTGGSKDSIVVSHTHTGTTANNGAHIHTITETPHRHNFLNAVVSVPTNATYTEGSGGFIGGSSASFTATANTDITINSGGAHTHTFTTNSEGSSGTNTNLPPYFALAYIMKS